MKFNSRRMILGGLLGLSLMACSSTPLDLNTFEEVNPTNLETGDPVETEISLAATPTTAPWTGGKAILTSPELNAELGADITTDNNGNVIASARITAVDSFEKEIAFSLSKLNPSGQLLWNIGRNYSPTFKSSYQIATDNNRNIYVVGGTTSNIDGQRINGRQDAFITKFSANGTVIWTRFIGTRLGDDGATGIGMDANNNAYVSGYVCGNGQAFAGKTIRGGCDMFVSKFSSMGVRNWIQLIGTNGNETAGQIAVRPDGTTAIAGTTTGSFVAFKDPQDMFIVKLNPQGATQWVQQFVAGPDFLDYASSSTHIAFDSVGDVINTGTEKFNQFNADGTLSKYSYALIRKSAGIDGASIWANVTDPIFDVNGKSVLPIYTDLQVTADNNIYVVSEARLPSAQTVTASTSITKYNTSSYEKLNQTQFSGSHIKSIAIRNNALFALADVGYSLKPDPVILNTYVFKYDLNLNLQ
jgi:hypothetical protein